MLISGKKICFCFRRNYPLIGLLIVINRGFVQSASKYFKGFPFVNEFYGLFTQ